MPTYGATGISVRLSTTSLAGTVTRADQLRKRKKEAAPTSEIIAARLRESDYLGEHNVPLAGDDQDCRLNFLQNTPFLQVEASLPPSGVEDDAALSKALVLHVLLSEQTFLHSFEDSKPMHLMIDVFFNGMLASSILMYLREICAGVKSFDQIFAGTRTDFLVERPWVIEPSSENTARNAPNSQSSVAAIDRWRYISAALLEEADQRGFNKQGDRSPSAAYLESLATMAMPDRVHNMQHPGGRAFGVIDVVVTAGTGKKTMTDYLKGPTRMVDDRYKKRRNHEAISKPLVEYDLGDEDAEGSTDSEFEGVIPNGLPILPIESALKLPSFASTLDALPHLTVGSGPSESPSFVDPKDLDIFPLLPPPQSMCAPQGNTQSTFAQQLRPNSSIVRDISLPSASHNNYTRHELVGSINHDVNGQPRPQSNISPSRALKFPYIGPMPKLKGPAPPIGLFTVTQGLSTKPKPKTIDPGLIDPDIPPSSLLISRLVIVGRNGDSLVDRHWAVPQRVPVNRRKRPQRDVNTGRFTKKVRSSPGSTEYREPLRSFRRKSTNKTPHRLKNLSSISHEPSDAGLKASHTSIGSVKEDDEPPRFIVPTITTASISDQKPVASAHGSGVPSANTVKTFDGSDDTPATPSAIVHELKSARQTTGILGIQGSNANPFMLETPAQLISHQAEDHQAHVHQEAELASINRSEVALKASELFNDINLAGDDTSSLSSLHTTPEPGWLPILSQAPLTTKQPLMSSLASNKCSQPKGKISASSRPSPPGSFPSGLASLLAEHKDRMDMGPNGCTNPRLNLNCVIRFGDEKDIPGGQTRQVKSERQGVFKEDMVVVGCRFFIPG